MCPRCRKPVALCDCAAARPRVPLADGAVRVSRESKGHGGKTVTVVRGLAGDDATLTALAKQLKAACGSGGTAKDGLVLLQGDHVERVLEWLAQQDLPAKQAGG